MTKEQFYLHTLADHWQEMGYPYAADLLRHHANEGVPAFREIVGGSPQVSERAPQGGGPVIFGTPDLGGGHNQAKLTFYHVHPDGQQQRLGSVGFTRPEGHAVMRTLQAAGHKGAEIDAARTLPEEWKAPKAHQSFLPTLNTARPEAPEQDWRPNEVLPEDYYGYSRKRKYARTPAQHLALRVAAHLIATGWEKAGHKTAAALLRHAANKDDQTATGGPYFGIRDHHSPHDDHLTRQPGLPAVRATGGTSLMRESGHIFIDSKLPDGRVAHASVEMPIAQAQWLMRAMHREGTVRNDNGSVWSGWFKKPAGKKTLPDLDTTPPEAPEQDYRPNEMLPEDFYGYSRKRLARAKARHDGRKAARKLARQIGVRRYANEHTPGFADWFAGSKVVGSDGRPLRVYHGTQRGDRIGTALVKGRATSGPMPFFTDDPEIASSYATGKADTSLESPPYEEQFTVKVPGQRRPVPLVRAWHLLPAADRQRIASLAPRVGMGDDSEPTLYPPGHASGSGGYDYHIREARGNHLAALVEEWLNSGNLFNEEHRFPDVLQLAGLSHPVQYHDPHAVRSSVLPAYLSMRNPLDTAAVPPAVVSALARAAGRQRPARRGGADFWDKNTRDAREWARQLADDVSAGANSHVWTSIPDWVTRTLRGLGYDGIKDTGGKQGGQGHTVYIPFHPSQVKSAIANRGSFNPRARKLTLAREKPLTVPIHAILPDKENLEVAADSLHRGHRSEDTRPLEVYRVGKRFVLADGHHRLLQAILAGDTTATVSPRETDRPPGTKYTVPLDPDADLYGLPDRLPRNGWLLKRLKLGRRRKYSHRAFGEQMRAEPGNGTHPLVWADYLQEQGHDEAADVVRRHDGRKAARNLLFRRLARLARGAGLRPGEPTEDGGHFEPEREPPDLGEYIANKFKGDYGDPEPGIGYSTGFLLSDGRGVPMGPGERYEDHRAAIPTTGAMRRWGWPEEIARGADQGTRTPALFELMRRAGAVRVHASRGDLVLHLASPLTGRQAAAIRSHVESHRPHSVVVEVQGGGDAQLDRPDPEDVMHAIARAMRPRPRRNGRPYRAPAGGTVVRGVFYEGGSLLPDLAGAFATGQTPSRPAPPPKSRKINWAAALRRWTGRQRNR